MGFVEMALGDYKEKEVLPEGEYTLRVAGSDWNDAHTTLSIWHDVEGVENAKTVFFNINLPKQGDSKKTIDAKLGFTVGYLKLFGIEFGPEGFNEEDLLGATARCRLKISEYEGIPRNEIVVSF